MECKFVNMIFDDEMELELIDTLWNVNIVSKSLVLHSLLELIDTLWNVNKGFLNF